MMFCAVSKTLCVFVIAWAAPIPRCEAVY